MPLDHPSNSDIIDLTTCDREPIRIPGSIQPHGILFVLERGTHRLLQASANANLLLVCPLEDALGKSFEVVAFISAVEVWNESKTAAIEEGPVILGAFDAHSVRYNGIAHRSGDTVVLEFEELSPDQAGSLDSLYPQVRAFLESLQSGTSHETANELAATQVRQITGFDRVLVYQFGEDWSGTVIAEDRNDALPSYLDLRFPASDIPAQARELYRLNRMRMIPDAHYQPVPIVPPVSPVTGVPVDLSLSILRSVSPVHLEYMRNMDTPSSMSVSIIRDGQLWGLISCHHSSPRRVPAHVRSACDFIAQILAMHISAKARSDQAVQRVHVQTIQSALVAAMAGEDFFVDGLKKHPDAMLSFAGATGVAIVYDDAIERLGRCPPDSGIRQIVDWLGAVANQTDVVCSHNLAAELPESEAFAEFAAGVLAISISQIHARYIIWFRPEVVQTVSWGGDPTAKLRAENDPQRLHPRKSFEIWKETVRLQSAPWTDVQIEAARGFRSAIVDIVMRKAEELAALNDELTRSNKELEAFSYSVSHDLRAPFRHIVGYAELLKEKYAGDLGGRAARYINIIIESAESAGKLVDGLLGFSQMGRMTIVPLHVDLNRLVADARNVLDTETAGREIEWKISNLPSVHGDPGMLRQVMQNVISNAIKYTKTRNPAVISISGDVTDTETIITISDNGVGFDMAYVGKLFGVFQRLHRIEDYEGTGIGLANVKRIIERHGGRAWAEGELNKGAAFHFALPHNFGMIK